jgi:hypothetical protein
MGRSPSRPRGAVDAGRPHSLYTVSVDEKPGVQALGLSAPDLPPRPGKTPAIGRDYEYIRHGTVSILAASTCTRATSSPTWKTAIVAWSSSGC